MGTRWRTRWVGGGLAGLRLQPGLLGVLGVLTAEGGPCSVLFLPAERATGGTRRAAAQRRGAKPPEVAAALPSSRLPQEEEAAVLVEALLDNDALGLLVHRLGAFNEKVGAGRWAERGCFHAGLLGAVGACGVDLPPRRLQLQVPPPAPACDACALLPALHHSLIGSKSAAGAGGGVGGVQLPGDPGEHGGGQAGDCGARGGKDQGGCWLLGWAG